LKLNKINLFLNLFFSLIVSNLLFYIFINYKIIFINLNYFLYDTLIGLFIGFFSFYLLKFLNYER
ncbi:MAG: hypothetical protein NZ484_01415, partial [Patescibacteria group bacterium]|nr:hypothetical protein [Patescibacteria group bacterium]